jgi:hypothetical protein
MSCEYCAFEEPGCFEMAECPAEKDAREKAEKVQAEWMKETNGKGYKVLGECGICEGEVRQTSPYSYPYGRCPLCGGI